MHVFCMCISRSFSSRMKSGVRKFRNLIEFDLQEFQTVASILFYFISVLTRVENLHIKNFIKNFIVLMLSFFTRTIRTRLKKTYKKYLSYLLFD